MTDYVLIHGAWHGSWCWARVRRLLAAGAHRVFTPTLTGVGERSHLLSRDVGLDTHVADVANLMIWEDLRDIVLVGHSYGGFVARHVADRMPDRIRSLIYLDAFVPENGKTLFDYLPDNGEGDRKLAVAHGDGWRVPPRPASAFAVNAADAAWVDRQCTMHPLSSLEDPDVARLPRKRAATAVPREAPGRPSRTGADAQERFRGFDDLANARSDFSDDTVGGIHPPANWRRAGPPLRFRSEAEPS